MVTKKQTRAGIKGGQSARRPKWKFDMWFHIKADAEKSAASLRRKGKETSISTSRNLNKPEGGKLIYNVWFR